MGMADVYSQEEREVMGRLKAAAEVKIQADWSPLLSLVVPMWQGRIDEVRILRAALSAAEVARDAFQADRDQLTEEAIELHKQLSERLAEVERLEAGLGQARFTLRLLDREVVCGRFDNAEDEIESITLLLGDDGGPSYPLPKQPRNAATEATDNPTPLWRQAWQRVMKAVGYTELNQTNDNEGVRSKGLYVDPREVAMRVEAALSPPMLPNRRRLQAVYDALAEHCQTAKHPSPLLLEQLQSLYRLLEDPA